MGTRVAMNLPRGGHSSWDRLVNFIAQIGEQS